MKINSDQKTLFWLFSAGYFLAALFYYPVFSELNRWTWDFFQCSLLKHTGCPCVFCGGSRSAFYFVTGHWATSWHYHAGVFVFSLSILTQAVLLLIASFLHKPSPWLLKHLGFWVLIGLLFMLQWGLHLFYPETLVL